ncbi:SIMPL domain-containing protein [Sphingomonas sp. RB3P16]|uniref:SIMPL domain-containing protein n=1 Tax=Parasphingomonas frigoris TaxID=3096163 RepID=UPI002FCA3030
MAFGLVAFFPMAVQAQAMPDLARPNTILVTASGKIETAPDLATLDLTLRGEGKTPDAATAAARQRAVFDGLRGLDRHLDIRTGTIAMREVRGGNCADHGTDDTGLVSMAETLDTAAETLDQMASGSGGAGGTGKGPCRVTGHVASTQTSVRLAAVLQAGTAVGLARRLGASSARVDGFGLRDDSAPARRALADAMADARAQAAALATASGLRLGPVVSIVRADPNGRVLFDVQDAPNMAMPAIAQAPVVLDIAPTPVETRVQLVVSFALLP